MTRLFEALAHDLRYAFRTLRRSPAFTLTAVATLTIGIGATTAVLSVVYGVLLRPLPYPAADRLVRLSEEHPGAVSPLREPMLSNLTYHAWNASPRAIEGLAAYNYREVTARFPDGPARVIGSAVTPSLFELLGMHPAAGRPFEASEAHEGADHVVVLSDELWRKRFGGDPAVVGRALVMEDEAYEIVGVMPRGFYFPDRETLFWVPRDVAAPSPDAVTGRQGRMSVLFAIARLRRSVSAAQAAAEGTAAARSMVRPMAANLLFGNGGPVVVHVRGIVDEMTASVRPALLVVGAAVMLVLLIACANVANLFLSRGVARQRELTVRAAIGAGRGRLVRQLLAESTLLSLASGALGVIVAWTLVRLTPMLASREFPRLADVRVDWRFLLVALAASAVAALASGLAPAWRAARVDLALSLHGGVGASAGGARAQRLGRALLVCEAAFSIVVIVGAALLGRSFLRLMSVDAGYTPQQVLTAQVYIPGAGAEARAREVRTVVDTVLARARALPGVVAAGIGNMAPLDHATIIGGFPVPGQFGAEHPKFARALLYTVTPGYAEALRLRLRSGRMLTDADTNAGIRPWIVNEEFARLYLPPNPIGFRFPWGLGEKERFTAEIVGVVANVLKNGNDSKAQPEVYQPARDAARFEERFELLVRTGDDPTALAPAVRQVITAASPAAAIETATLSQRVAESVSRPRFAALVLVAFALIALVLGAIGLYGALSYSVSQRRRELGVRSALGAARADLVALVVRDGLGVTIVGIIVGLAAAVAFTRLMQAALFGVTPLDPVAFLLAPAPLLVVALAASLIPARRAARVDPAEALRSE